MILLSACSTEVLKFGLLLIINQEQFIKQGLGYCLSGPMKQQYHSIAKFSEGSDLL